MIRPLKKHEKARVAACAVGLLISGLTSATAQAQWVVTDPAMQGEVTGNQLTQITHMIQEYTQMVTQYQSLLSDVQSLNLNLLPVNSQLTLITHPERIVQQSCPAASVGGTIVGALGMNPSLVDGEIVAQQATICANIVLLQVDKYNTVAAMLNHMTDYFAAIQQMSDKVNRISDAVGSALGGSGSAGSSGDRQGVQNQADQLRNSLAAEMAQVQQHLQAVDTTIGTLKDQQSMLANIALKGSNATGVSALAGQAIQAGAFAAAFPQ